MFCNIFFGWSKASKCKKSLKRARCTLRQVKNRRETMAKYLRKDLAELIHNGYDDAALKRVNKLIQDERLAIAYEMLDNFCEFILMKLSYIRRNKDCPQDINEAVSSLIFASARCGDLPELRVIRNLFGQRYGQEFVTAAVELYPGNLVNKQLQENLSEKSVSDDLKSKVIDEIAIDKYLLPEVLAIEYHSDWQQLQEKENRMLQLVECDAKANETISGCKINRLEVQDIERDVICSNSSISNSSDNFSLPESCLIDNSALLSTVQNYPPYSNYPLQEKVEEVEEFHEPFPLATSEFQNKVENMALVPYSEILSSPTCAKARVDYIDEYQFSVSEDDSWQRDKTRFGYDESDMDGDELTRDRSSIMSFRKKKQEPKKRSRRRSVLLKGQGIMDIGYLVYCHKPYRKKAKPLPEGIPKSSYPQMRLKQHSSSQKGKSLNSDMCDCSLDQPCYCCFYTDQDYFEDLSVKPKGGVRDAHVQQEIMLSELCHYKPLCHGESIKGMELVTIPQKQNSESYNQSGIPNTKGSYSSDKSSNPRTYGTLKRAEIAPSYSRALTIPLERSKNWEDKILRTYSFPIPRPKHVHPKLPDYDDIVANFSSLKREHLENKDFCKEQMK
ncbi:hypothetical protein TanjilG_03059 [Lupinus angustifolius]|uniref:IST1-like protein n=1 Tax=Lupinus angustifolius TaxID=3871 RepID=A0A4P1RCZ1_LUPAN|nr:PREDICTED: uncharacterized protein LOC109352523 [Lupinus angustifolius]OIW08383.1 hypothetical protein TanjilG_03059 [Lupinus angustifolius]